MSFQESCPLSPQFPSNGRSQSIFSTETFLLFNALPTLISTKHYQNMDSISVVFHHHHHHQLCYYLYFYCMYFTMMVFIISYIVVVSSLPKLVSFKADQVFTVPAYMNVIILLSWGQVQSLRCGTVSLVLQCNICGIFISL